MDGELEHLEALKSVIRLLFELQKAAMITFIKRLSCS